MSETPIDNLEALKQTIYNRIQQILISDDLSESEKVDLLDQAYTILFE